MSKIHAAIAAVMDDIGAIAKSNRNQQQGFNFRGIDQVYNALHPIMAKHKVFTVPKLIEVLDRSERATKSGGVLTFTLLSMQYDFVSGEDGSSVTVGPILGEGMDSGDKGCNKAMAIAHKYALFQTFLIPTEEAIDPDSESHTDVLPRPNKQPSIEDMAKLKKLAEGNPEREAFVNSDPAPEQVRMAIKRWAA